MPGGLQEMSGKDKRMTKAAMGKRENRVKLNSTENKRLLQKVAATLRKLDTWPGLQAGQ